jgi:hypothetical protein
MGAGARSADQGAMATMNALEISDREHGSRERIGSGRRMFETVSNDNEWLRRHIRHEWMADIGRRGPCRRGACEVKASDVERLEVKPMSSHDATAWWHELDQISGFGEMLPSLGAVTCPTFSKLAIASEAKNLVHRGIGSREVASPGTIVSPRLNLVSGPSQTANNVPAGSPAG